MKRILAYIALGLLLDLCIPARAGAQKITDSSYRILGYIEPDGKIKDSSYRIIGYIQKDGKIASNDLARNLSQGYLDQAEME